MENVKIMTAEGSLMTLPLSTLIVKNPDARQQQRSRTQSNIYGEAFFENSLSFLQKALSETLQWVLNTIRHGQCAYNTLLPV